MKKEGVFSMGMVLLQAAQLDDVYQCYDYAEHLFIEANLEGMIEGINERYSSEFIEVVTNILEPNPIRRASLMEIKNMLQQYWNSQKERKEVTKE